MQIIIKKKILLIADSGIVVPPKGYGGIERVVGALAEEYIKIGYDVHILASKGSSIKDATIIANGTPGFPQSKINRFLSLLKTWGYLIRHYKDY